jgi:sulfotransferase family protein
MIVWLASYPRSGNTYLRLLLHHSLGMNTYSVYDDPLIEELELSDEVGHVRLPGPLETLAQAAELYFVKSHELPTDDRPAVYLVRDGRDAVVSYAHFLCAFFKHRGVMGQIGQRLFPQDFGRMLRDVIIGHRRLGRWQYGGWSQNVLAWTRRPRCQTLVVRYEELVAQPDVWLGKIAEMFRVQGGGGRPTSVPDFARLHERWPQFFRRGRPGAWKDEMPAEVQALFWHHHAEGMAAMGYA